MKAGKECLADQGHVFDNAAGPGYRNLTGNIVFAAQFGADEQYKIDQISCGLGEGLLGDGVTGIG